MFQVKVKDQKKIKPGNELDIEKLTINVNQYSIFKCFAF